MLTKARLAGLALLLAGVPSWSMAQEADLVSFLSGQGCTLGDDSRAAAVSGGFGVAEIDALHDAMLDAPQAVANAITAFLERHP